MPRTRLLVVRWCVAAMALLYELDTRHAGGPMWIAGRRQDPDQLQRVTRVESRRAHLLAGSSHYPG